MLSAARLALVLLAVTALSCGSGWAFSPTGNEFWLAWPYTQDLSETPSDPEFDSDASLVVLTEAVAPVAVLVEAEGFDWRGEASRDFPATITIPRSLMVDSDGLVESKGIRVVAEGCASVSVLFRVPGSGSSVGDDALRVLPTSQYGTVYYPDTYHGEAEFVVVAVEDGTTVSWDNPHCPGLSRFTLNRGETVQHQCFDGGVSGAEQNGIVGTRIESDRPVSVIAGSAASQVIHFLEDPPLSIFWQWFDVLMEQMKPVELWEDEYRTALVALDPTWTGDLVRILASCDGTLVEIDDRVEVRSQTLAAGEHWDVMETDLVGLSIDLLPGPSVIRASHPVQVSQFTVGHAKAGIGDPSQVMLPGLRGAAGTTLSYLLEGYEPYVNVIVPATASSDVTLDGLPLPAGTWFDHVDGAYVWTRLSGLDYGQHRISAPEPIAVTVVGYTTDGAELLAGGYSYQAAIAGVDDPFLVSIVATPACTERCGGECVDLDAGEGYAEYMWSTGERAREVRVCPDVTTEYSVGVRDEHGCDGRGATRVVVLEPPAVSIGASATEACEGECVELSVSEEFSSVLWSTGATESGITYCPPPGTSNVGVVVEDERGCTGEDVIEIHTLPMQLVDAGPDRAVCDGVSVPIGGAPTATGGSGSFSYSWTPTAGLDDPTAANPIATPTADTLYSVEVTDGAGCVSSDSVLVTLLPEITPESAGNSLLQVKVLGTDIDLFWLAAPGAATHKLKSSEVKDFSLPLVELSTPASEASLEDVVPPPAWLIFYRVNGASCSGLEGP